MELDWEVSHVLEMGCKKRNQYKHRKIFQENINGKINSRKHNFLFTLMGSIEQSFVATIVPFMEFLTKPVQYLFNH